MRTLLTLLLLTLPVDAFEFDLRRPADGDHALRILTPQALELELVSRKPKGEPLPYWDVVNARGIAQLPATTEFRVLINGEDTGAEITELGFKRRPLYAPLGTHDLRVGSQIYLLMEAPLDLRDGDRVEVKLPAQLDHPADTNFATTFGRRRHSPAIHTNHVGYQLGFPKQAIVGYYLGDAGELPIGESKIFYLREVSSGKKVHSGTLKHIRDIGFSFPQAQYQRVLTADFTDFDRQGTYVLGISSLGESHPFTIGHGLFANIARTYALGLYHQRSGMSLGLPYTRFTRPSSHTAPVRIPGKRDRQANDLVDGMAEEPHQDQEAPELTSYGSSLYPIQKSGTLPANGGHHDAGDYSKYTTNCAQLIHHLMFAHDALPGVGKIDNLGLPESGDGVGDLMQIALHEARFLSQLQDDDGGFFFLVYPEDRKYEDDVPPEQAGGQIVFPKNTAATAAAAAALAQLGSSPSLKDHAPELAAGYLAQAEAAWKFLEGAWAQHGTGGAYQRISHYGDVFMDRDEIIWAATELFLATGTSKYHDFVLNNYKPSDPSTRKWGWLRLFEGYGAAARSYAYAKTSGKATIEDLDPGHLRSCQQEIWGWGKELAKYADHSAYGLSFPSESKAFKAAGWYFPISDTLDLVAAAAQTDSREWDRTIVSNMNYELGANPTNTCFLAGLGFKRPFEIVHQWARNDDFLLPMTGIPVGSLVSGLPWLGTYERELGSVVYPPDGDPQAPYAFYDRVTDTFNVATEFVTYQQGRALAAAAFMMAKTPLAAQDYQPLPATITGVPRGARQGDEIKLGLTLDGDVQPDLDRAVIVWEARGLDEPQVGRTLSYRPGESGPCWASVEAQWPDGRRAFARADFPVTASNASAPAKPTSTTAFYFSGDSHCLKPGTVLHTGKATSHHTGKLEVSVTGSPSIDNSNLQWMEHPTGGAIRFNSLGDSVTFTWENSPPAEFELSGWFYFEKFPHAVSTSELFAIGRDAGSPAITLQFDKWAEPRAPQLIVSDQGAISPETLADAIRLERWHHLSLQLTPTRWQLAIDGESIGSGKVIAPERIRPFFEGSSQTIQIGNFIGLADDLHLRTTGP